MTQHNPEITLRQVLDYATEASAMCAGRTVADFEKDRLWCLAVEQLFVYLGGASQRLSLKTQQQLAHIPWRQIAAFRNRMVHGYDSVDYNRLWLILQNDIPQLITELEKLELPEFD
jgi:uncharacterized protein with HEPN domain